MKDMRTFISEYEQAYPEDFVRFKEEVDPKYQLSAVVQKFDSAGRQPVIVFENVKGYDTPVVCNIESGMEKLAIAMGVAPGEVEEAYRKAEEKVISGDNSFAPVEVKASEAPVKEVIIPREKVDFNKFPIISHHMGEVPYLTRAVGVARDPEDGYLHAAYYRLMVKGKNHMVTHLTPGRHLWYMYKKAEAMGKPLPMAFYVGSNPAWSFGVQSRISHPPTEFDVIGALQGEPLQMVRCETNDILVPAATEMVIEGELRPGGLEDEGPWRDFTRYHQTAQRHSFSVNAVTCRKDLIFQDSGAWVKNGVRYAIIPIEVFLERELKRVVPSVKQFKTGSSHMIGYISMDKKHASEPKMAIMSAFTHELYLKYIYVFDTDIDLNNESERDWALATRAQADRDFFIIPGILGTDLDLSAPQEAFMTKVGFDATAKPFRSHYPELGKISEEYMSETDISKYL